MASNKLLRYPLQRIEAQSDYLKVTAVKYTPPGLGSGDDGFFNIPRSSNVNGAGANKTILGTIFLPIPEGLSDMNQTNWNSSELSSLSGAGARELQKLVKSVDIDKLLSGQIGEVGQSALESLKGSFGGFAGGLDQKVRDSLGGAAIAEVVNLFGANIDQNSFASRTQGVIINPNLELLFKGVDLRSFSFAFDMTPRSRDESNEIKAIINTFKRRMAPKTTIDGGTSASRGIFIQAPDVFDLEFKSGGRNHPFLFKMKTCALTNIQVNYAGTGAYTTYEDGTPIKMRMTLSFRELNPIYAEDYNQFGLDEGVGF